ncbi:MAG: integration host factor subunit beta [Alphaproteobacteria bacterium]|jgi:integration host factor subunit beta|nr:integration host factor subunit beta [Alphaproteobacteria bacterium]MBT5390174.1 integration host factor subunit beta [Alphaproteobacteria bacterium]MBT5541092.1 integration host factor subunit beta [Alphaproteobacteria bacterium]MBT5654605.1 integration host factor subunit beta [Alphaproteobacteria bacterium]
MTKSQLIERLRRRFSNLPEKHIENAINVIFDEIISTLSKNARAEFRGFGAFSTKKRAPRVGRNPKTGSSVSVPAKTLPYFKSGRILLSQMNKD